MTRWPHIEVTCKKMSNFFVTPNSSKSENLFPVTRHLDNFVLNDETAISTVNNLGLNWPKIKGQFWHFSTFLKAINSKNINFLGLKLPKIGVNLVCDGL